MKLGDIMRVQHGLEPKEQIQHVPLSEKAKEYFASLKKEKEVVIPDFNTLMEMFQSVYESQNGRKYIGTCDEQLRQIVLYFSNDIAFIPSGQRRSFKKGLLLTGTYGLGKTTIMRAIRECLDPSIKFGFNSCVKVVNIFDTEGRDVIRRFSNYKDFYFDDFGAEDMGSNYGKENVMEKILEERYLSYQKQGVKTHLSTNLSFAEIEAKYGQRVGSRIHEMFNVIAFKGDDYRKKL